MTRAAATFARQGEVLVVQAQQGLILFNFPENENVQIDAGEYRFSAIDRSNHIGELGLNRNGQLVMNMKEGAFAALNTNTGERTEVSANRPLVVLAQSGQGQLTKGGKSLRDTSKIYQANELKGMCVVGASEAFRIVGNTTSVISIDGAWKTNSGAYDYRVVECTKQAMMSAGASEASATAAAKGAAAAGAAGAMSSHVKALVIAGVGAAGGLGIGIYEATKSSSSR
jgi:hypothetical protein